MEPGTQAPGSAPSVQDGGLWPQGLVLHGTGCWAPLPGARPQVSGTSPPRGPAGSWPPARPPSTKGSWAGQWQLVPLTQGPRPQPVLSSVTGQPGAPGPRLLPCVCSQGACSSSSAKGGRVPGPREKTHRSHPPRHTQNQEHRCSPFEQRQHHSHRGHVGSAQGRQGARNTQTQ